MAGCVKCRAPLAQPETGRPRRYCSDACRQASYRRRNRKPRGTFEVLSSSRTDEWPTDPAVFTELDKEFGPFTLDPCATPENAKCPSYFTRDDDGLRQPWTGRVFMNPPYGRPLGLWMRKAYESAQTTAELVVCLVPARTDTAWFHDYATRGDIRYLRGRLRFGQAGQFKNSAPFASILVVFRNPLAEFGVTEAVEREAA